MVPTGMLEQVILQGDYIVNFFEWHWQGGGIEAWANGGKQCVRLDEGEGSYTPLALDIGQLDDLVMNDRSKAPLWLFPSEDIPGT